MKSIFLVLVSGFALATAAGCGSNAESSAPINEDDVKARAQHCNHAVDCTGNKEAVGCEDDVQEDLCAFTCDFADVKSTSGVCHKNKAFKPAPVSSTSLKAYDECVGVEGEKLGKCPSGTSC